MKIYVFHPVYDRNSGCGKTEQYLIFDDNQLYEGQTVQDYIRECIDDDSYGEVWYWDVDAVYEYKFDTIAEARRRRGRTNLEEGYIVCPYIPTELKQEKQIFNIDVSDIPAKDVYEYVARVAKDLDRNKEKMIKKGGKKKITAAERYKELTETYTYPSNNFQDIISMYACPVENFNESSKQNNIYINIPTKEEFDKLKEDVEEMKKLLSELVEQLKNKQNTRFSNLLNKFTQTLSSGKPK